MTSRDSLPLGAEIDRLRAALMFYADKANWDTEQPAQRGETIEMATGKSHFVAKPGKRLPDALRDCGNKARAALAGKREAEGK